MNNYEIMFLFDEKSDPNEVMETIRNLLKTVENTSLEITDLGSKKLAYEIRKQTMGHYFLATFQAETFVIPELNRVISLQKDIMRYLIINKDKNYGAKALKNVKKIEAAKKRNEHFQKISNMSESEKILKHTAMINKNIKPSKNAIHKTKLKEEYTKIATFGVKDGLTKTIVSTIVPVVHDVKKVDRIESTKIKNKTSSPNLYAVSNLAGDESIKKVDLNKSEIKKSSTKSVKSKVVKKSEKSIEKKFEDITDGKNFASKPSVVASKKKPPVTTKSSSISGKTKSAKDSTKAKSTTKTAKVKAKTDKPNNVKKLNKTTTVTSKKKEKKSTSITNNKKDFVSKPSVVASKKKPPVTTKSSSISGKTESAKDKTATKTAKVKVKTDKPNNVKKLNKTTTVASKKKEKKSTSITNNKKDFVSKPSVVASKKKSPVTTKSSSISGKTKSAKDSTKVKSTKIANKDFKTKIAKVKAKTDKPNNVKKLNKTTTVVSKKKEKKSKLIKTKK